MPEEHASGFRFPVMTYGESSGHWVNGNELRIGYEPGGICVVLSTGRGGWPIRYASDSAGVTKRFDTTADAMACCESYEAYYKEHLMQ